VLQCITGIPFLEEYARCKALHHHSTIKEEAKVKYEEVVKASDESVWQASEVVHQMVLTKMRPRKKVAD